MSKVVVFAGTTEGRKISEWLCSEKVEHTVCVATEYGEQILSENALVKIHQGRMDEQEMEVFLKEVQPKVVIDATHPYAKIVTENIKKAVQTAAIPYLRLERNNEQEAEGCRTQYFKDVGECVEVLKKTKGNILLTTGSKELESFCQDENIKKRLFVRVLPGKESIAVCDALGICGKNIIAMQGPFSIEMNVALIRQFSIEGMVTKASGSTGGFFEKTEAARKANIPVFVIGRPKEENGISFVEVCKKVSHILGLQKDERKSITVSLIGCGMGQQEQLTKDAAKALKEAQVVFGAKRLLESLKVEQEHYPYYLAGDILPVLKENPRNAAILFSGDLGFYSGAKKMHQALQAESKESSMEMNIKSYPGISSISNLVALIGESWEDVKIVSVHGKGEPEQWKAEMVNEVRKHRKTFVLLSGVRDLNAIGQILTEGNLSECKVIVGYQMAQENQELLTLSPEACKERREEGLYSLLILNELTEDEILTTGIADEEFIRNQVPMTKEEVRTVSISKMKLKKDAVVYDIGSGTGSIAVEVAKLNGVKQVYAIERNPQAIALIRKNIEKFHLSNVCVVEGDAPEVLQNLPAPTNIFIGGSGGRFQDILEEVRKKNQSAMVVANAVSYETVQEFMQIEKKYEMEHFEMITMSVTRTRKVGAYHMMNSENQIFICSFRFKG